MKILSFGEILWDVYPDKSYIGGAPLNFAAHLARHRDGVFMLSAVGKDELGRKALERLYEWGVSARYVSVMDGKPTGRCDVTLDESSVPSYNLLNDVAYDYIDSGCICEDFDVLYFGTLALRGRYNFSSLVSFLKRSCFEEVFVDINIRSPFYSEKTVRFSLENATIVKVSDEELPIVARLLGIKETDYNGFAMRLSELYGNLKYIIITLGADGAYALDTMTGKEYFSKAKEAEVKSTVGAGDSFSAAFLHKYMDKNDISVCLEYASRVAGFVVSQYDAVPDYEAEE